MDWSSFFALIYSLVADWAQNKHCHYPTASTMAVAENSSLLHILMSLPHWSPCITTFSKDPLKQTEICHLHFGKWCKAINLFICWFFSFCKKVRPTRKHFKTKSLILSFISISSAHWAKHVLRRPDLVLLLNRQPKFSLSLSLSLPLWAYPEDLLSCTKRYIVTTRMRARIMYFYCIIRKNCAKSHSVFKPYLWFRY